MMADRHAFNSDVGMRSKELVEEFIFKTMLDGVREMERWSVRESRLREIKRKMERKKSRSLVCLNPERNVSG